MEDNSIQDRIFFCLNFTSLDQMREVHDMYNVDAYDVHCKNTTKIPWVVQQRCKEMIDCSCAKIVFICAQKKSSLSQ